MDEVVKTLVIIMALSLGVAITSGVAVFSGAERGTAPDTGLLVTSLVLLIVDIWYIRRLFVTPERIPGSE